MDLFKLVGSIFINNKDANSQIDDTDKKAQNLATKIGSAMETAGNKITGLGKAIAPVSAVLATALTVSTKSASDFQNGMAKMSTLFDTSKTSVSGLSKEFLTLSNKTGLSATELAEAGYQALSAGQSVDKVGKFVETAGNLAKAGFTSTTTAVDVLTTTMNAYGKSAGSANQIANKLVRTQNLGKTTVDELASSMGQIIPTASSMGVNINNLTSGYVSLTKQGIATAEATTYMNSMFNELGDSGTTLGGVIKKKTGKSFQECMNSGMSLADVLQVTKQYADENGIAYNELWSSAEAGKAGLAILNGGVGEFNKTVETMASDTDDVGEALDKLETPSVKAHKAINRIKNSGIELGTAFIGALAPTLEKVCGVVEKVTTWFSSLDNHTKTMIATVMGIGAVASPVLIIGGKLLSGVGSFIIKLPQLISTVQNVAGGFSKLFSILTANPIALVVVAIAGLVAGFIHLWNTSEEFRNFWMNLWNNIKEIVSTCVNAVVGFFTGLWTDIVNIFNSIKEALTTAWETIKNVVQVAVMFIVEIIKGAFTLITLPFMMIWENCKEVLTNAWNAYKTIVTNNINAVKNVITTVMNAIKTVFTTVWNAIKSNIIVPVMNAIKTVISSVWNSIKSTVTSVVNAIKSVITTVFNAVKSTVTNILNRIKSTFSSVWNSIKSVVSGAINGVKSTISSGLNGAKSVVSSVLGSIKSKFSSIFESCKSIVSGAINKIKGFFKFSWSLPKLKMPHPTISGKFSLNPPSVPHFGIEWYKKAMDNPMMFTEPTLFDVNPLTGQAKGAGEAGDEMMYGHQNLMEDIDMVVSTRNNSIVEALDDLFGKLFDILSQYFPEFTKEIVLDTGVVASQIAPKMDTELGKITNHKGRGN